MSAQELRRQRGYIKGKQTKIWNYVEGVASKRTTTNFETIAVYVDKLEQIYKEFGEIQRKLVVVIDEDELPIDDVREDDVFEERYVELRSTLSRWSATMKPNVSTEANSESLAHVLEQQTEIIRSLGSSRSNVDSKIKLPTIKLPTFSGEIEDWKRFSDTFTALIHGSELPAIQKHQYLVGAVSGNAAKIIESVEISAQNYEIAWNLLKNRYEDGKALKRRHLQCLFGAPKVDRESAVAIQDLINHVQKHLRILKSMESNGESWADALILYMVEEKLDEVTRRRWEESMEGQRDVSAELLFEFLQRRVQMLDRLGALSKGEASSKKSGSKFGRSNLVEAQKWSRKGDSRASKSAQTGTSVSLATSVAGRCYVCNGAHLIYVCEKFLNLSEQERIDEVKRLNLCFNCLRNDHFVSACRASSCRRCAGRHNTLCHKDKEKSPAGNSEVASRERVDREPCPGSNQDVNLSVHHAVKRREVGQMLMSTAIVYVRDADGCVQPVRVLLDSASEASFITKAACVKLNIKIVEIREGISGIGNSVCTVTEGCRVTIKSRVTDHQFSAFCLVVPRITRELPSVTISDTSFPVTNTLKLADPRYFHPSQIDMLLGSEFFLKLLEPAKIELGNNLPTLQDTKLGWIISGPIPVQYIKRESVSHVACMATSLNEAIVKFWEIEDCSNRDDVTLSSEERACEEMFEKTHSRDKEGRFIVRLPFRDNKHELGGSRSVAEKRLLYLERRFTRDKSFKKLYTEFMREYIQLNHMSVVPTTAMTDGPVVYLPHHGVLRESAVSTRLRVVFDASAKTSSGTSLNDVLMVGAALQDPLFNIVLRFRMHAVVITADLRKMYRQILVHSSDRDYQRILWRSSPDEEIKEFQLNTVTYGQSCAPFLAIRSVRQLASEAESRYPRAARVLLRDLYVDDVLTGVDNFDEASLLIDELTKLLGLGQFELHKWRSSCAEALFSKSDSNVSSDCQDITNERDVVKTLGLRWQPSSDELRFESCAAPDADTKRGVLASISRLFDPLGLASPLVIRAKMIMQCTWQLGLSWDDKLPTDVLRAWSEYIRDITKISAMRIPRRVIDCRDPMVVDLHAFCDASERAYGACVYVWAIDGTGRAVSGLLCAKSRVAPVKKLTIPRLELCGAVVLVDLVRIVLESLTTKICKIYAWSDSSVVLAWIAGEPSRQKTFVSNRVAKIQSVLPNLHWGHVAGEENPADLISRGTTFDVLNASSLWWSGPPWLSEFEEKAQQSTRVTELSEREVEVMRSEERSKTQIFVTQVVSDSAVELVLGKFSGLTRIERVLAWCLRFVGNSRNKMSDREFGNLTVKELRLAQLVLIKYTQNQYFGRELHELTGKGRVSGSSVLVHMSPFIDGDGVLRVGGRLQRSALSFDRKHPILLPAKSRYTQLLFEREHFRMLHAGPQALLSSIRGKFWPLSGRNTARRVVGRCAACFKAKPTTLSQMMGPLPPDRTACQRVFSVVGVDYAGPIVTLANRGRGQKTRKSYIALFVCFSTKAIHLETVSDLTSDAFLAALRRFVSRRGLPRRIYSDNATNFVGARRELNELYQAIRTTFKESIENYCTSRHIEWKFIPPRAPHMGGIWEAGIKSCKYHLRRVVGETRLTFEELNTVLTQIEACLNSRPLCRLSSDPHDLQALTPAHFLVGEPLTAVPDVNVTDIAINRLDRWQLTQRLAQHFWKRWSVEYLTSLQGKCKWTIEQRNLAIDDIVMVVDEKAPPLQWKIGRVIELHPGIDKKVRVVTVKTADSVIKRAIVKLCKLPIDDGDKN